MLQNTNNSAQEYEERCIEVLRKNGYRITMPRIQVIRSLADSEVALSAYGVHKKIVNAGGRIDVVSVYRILSTLMENGLIHHIGILDGYIACTMMDSHKVDIAHLIDRDRGVVKEVEIDERSVIAIRKLLAGMDFEPESIKMEITGRFVKAKR